MKAEDYKCSCVCMTVHLSTGGGGMLGRRGKTDGAAWATTWGRGRKVGGRTHSLESLVSDTGQQSSESSTLQQTLLPPRSEKINPEMYIPLKLLLKVNLI